MSQSTPHQGQSRARRNRSTPSQTSTNATEYVVKDGTDVLPGGGARKKRTKKKKKKQPEVKRWKCYECNCTMPENQRPAHISGREHEKAVESARKPARPRLPETVYARRVKSDDKVKPLISGDFHGLAEPGAKLVKNQRLHPNGQRKIAIHQVKDVYRLPYPIPLEAFGCVYSDTKVTPESVEAAIDVVNSQDFFHHVGPIQQQDQDCVFDKGAKRVRGPRYMFKEGVLPGPRDFY